MPTFSLYYLNLPNHRNLWTEPAASLLNPVNMYMPSNRTTGELDYPLSPWTRHLPNVHSGGWRRASARRRTSRPCVYGASIRRSSALIRIISQHRERLSWARCRASLCTPSWRCWCASVSRPAKPWPPRPITTRIQFGWNELGQIAPGRRADILVLDGDPTMNIWNVRRISTLIVDGNVMDRDALLKPRR